MRKIKRFLKRQYYNHMIEVCDSRAIMANKDSDQDLYKYWSMQKIDFVMKSISC